MTQHRARGYRRVPWPPQPSTTPRPPQPQLAPEPSPERYPPPSHAATVWFTPQGIRLALAASLAEPGHTVLLPLRDASWDVLTSILRERARNDRASRTIGHRSAPVQYDVETLLRAMTSRVTTRSLAKPTRELTLDELATELDKPGASP